MDRDCNRSGGLLGGRFSCCDCLVFLDDLVSIATPTQTQDNDDPQHFLDLDYCSEEANRKETTFEFQTTRRAELVLFEST